MLSSGLKHVDSNCITQRYCNVSGKGILRSRRTAPERSVLMICVGRAARLRAAKVRTRVALLLVDAGHLFIASWNSTHVQPRACADSVWQPPHSKHRDSFFRLLCRMLGTPEKTTEVFTKPLTPPPPAF